jgi:hypothetical protein
MLDGSKWLSQERILAISHLRVLSIFALPHPSIQRRPGYMQCIADILNALGRVVMQCLRRLDFFALARVFVEPWPSAFPASGPSGFYACFCALLDNVTLKFS